MDSCRSTSFLLQPLHIGCDPVRLDNQGRRHTLRAFKPERHLASEAGRSSNLPGDPAEDSIGWMNVNRMDHPGAVNFLARSDSLSLRVQNLFLESGRYECAGMNVKKKGEVVVFFPAAIAARIRELRKSLGKNQGEFGRMLGVSQSAVSNWEIGTDVPAPRILAALAEMTADIALRSELLDRAGFKEVKAAVPQQREDLRSIPLLSDPAAAGTNRVIDEREIEKHLLLPREWFHRGGELFALKIKGDSMAPIIDDGYIVIVDTGQRDPKKLLNRMVAARDGDGVTIKWLRRDVGVYLLLPQNISPRHQVRVLSSDAGHGIVGEVVKWIGEPSRK